MLATVLCAFPLTSEVSSCKVSLMWIVFPFYRRGTEAEARKLTKGSASEWQGKNSKTSLQPDTVTLPHSWNQDHFHTVSQGCSEP